MLIIKMVHADSSVLVSVTTGFQWDTDNPNIIEYVDQDGDMSRTKPGVAQVFVYSGPFIVFTRDLTTGQPVEHYHV